ncbi:PREDICTED: ankyrin-3-like [Wasmannia auropunctata]|uniref:ankyrin-3-like n=1 Tax=Wasmannia auropunctata TaxID=64793 RepID=UPI0005EFC5E9|nr:PREDICTED: ankyrin-3-like [Wasmannia auropunctata]
MSSNREKLPGNENNKKNPSSKEDSPSDDKKDDGSASTGSNGGTTEEPSQPGSKPSSVGAIVREEAQRLLDLAARREWDVVDQLLKSLEKTVQSTGEDGFIVPLAGVLDTTTGMTPLMYAVKDNRSELFDRMIKLGSDVNARNIKGKIPLLLAIEAGNQSICRKLLAHQAPDQLCATTPAGDSAMHLAARRRDIDMMRILVDYGAAVNMQNSDGQTALHIASAEGDKTLVKYLYDVRASASITDHQDCTPMHLAVENGHATIIELLVDKFKADIFETTKDGSTLMHIASLNGHSECVTMLLKKGVYLHMTNKHGARSIHTAAGYGHVGIISTLLQRGEKVDAITNDNCTALHIAVESAKPAVVKTLLGYGADVHVRGGKLWETPLHIAAKVVDGDKCALLLLKSGANPNLTINDGQTPVHVAASHGNLAALLLLLDNDGDPMFKSKKGETPLHLACRSCRADVVRHLIEFVKEKKGSEVAAAYVNSLTNEGASALHYVVLIESSEVGTPGDDRAIIHVLLESGANVSLQTRQTQESAFHHCALAGNNEVLTEMISRMSATEMQKVLNRQNAMGWTPLLIAAHRGHMEIVTTILANHGRVDVFDLEGRSALHLAAEHGYLQVCDVLLANKAFINSKSYVGNTALHLAAMNGYTHLVQFFVQGHRAEIDVLTLRKQTPLHLAAGAGQLEVCKLLLELGASIDATDDQGQMPIHAAVMNNYAEVAQLFLQRHAGLMMACTNDGNTCAHIAAMQGSVRMIEELMKFDKQSMITARNKLTETTPLQLAAEGGHAEIVKALIKAGASCADENCAGFTAVHLAAQHGHCHILEVMRSSQSLRISSKKLGVTALHVAAYFGQAAVESVKPAVVETLLGYGAKVHVRGGKLWETPLHIAARVADGDECALMLLQSGANPNLTINDGQTSVHAAASHGNLATLLLLLRNDGDPMFKSKTGETPLHLACRGCRADVVRHLIEFVKERKGAEVATAYVNSLTNEGASALHYVALIESSEVGTPGDDRSIIHVLLESGANVSLQTRQTQESAFHRCALAGNNEVLTEMISRMSATEMQKALNQQNAVGWTPLLIAAHRGHTEMVTTILANHGRVDVFDLDGRSAFHLAAEHGYLQVCDALLANKAFINSKSYVGNTALHLAAMNGYTHLVQFLVQDHRAEIDVLTLRKQTPLHLAAGAGSSKEFLHYVRVYTRHLTRHIVQRIVTDSMYLLHAIELLFFAIFGKTTYEQFRSNNQSDWRIVLFKLTYGIYMLVSVVMLINLLIATMSNTYQRIQAQSDTEWKYGLSKLIRRMNRTTMAPPPLNLLTMWIMYFVKLCKKRTTKKQQPLSLTHEMNGARLSPRTRMGAKWLSMIKKNTQVVHKDSVALSVAHLSPLGSQLSFHNAIRIENVVDWDVVRRKYRHLYEQKLVQESKETIENPLAV